MSEQKNVLMVCLGNICRSPIAAAVFNHVAKSKGLDNIWKSDSAAVGPWHVGNSMDSRAASTLAKHGLPHKDHVVKQLAKEHYNFFDYIFGMDEQNIKDIKRKAPSNSKAKIELLVSYDPEGASTIRDPYYDDGAEGFEECYQIAFRACSAFLDKHNK